MIPVIPKPPTVEPRNIKRVRVVVEYEEGEADFMDLEEFRARFPDLAPPQ